MHAIILAIKIAVSCASIALALLAQRQVARCAESVAIQHVGKGKIAATRLTVKMHSVGSKTLLKRLLSAELLVNTPLVSDVGKKCLLVPEIARKMQRSGCVRSAKPRTTASNVIVTSSAFTHG